MLRTTSSLLTVLLAASGCGDASAPEAHPPAASDTLEEPGEATDSPGDSDTDTDRDVIVEPVASVPAPSLVALGLELRPVDLASGGVHPRPLRDPDLPATARKSELFVRLPDDRVVAFGHVADACGGRAPILSVSSDGVAVDGCVRAAVGEAGLKFVTVVDDRVVVGGLDEDPTPTTLVPAGADLVEDGLAFPDVSPLEVRVHAFVVAPGRSVAGWTFDVTDRITTVRAATPRVGGGWSLSEPLAIVGHDLYQAGYRALPEDGQGWLWAVGGGSPPSDGSAPSEDFFFVDEDDALSVMAPIGADALFFVGNTALSTHRLGELAPMGMTFWVRGDAVRMHVSTTHVFNPVVDIGGLDGGLWSTFVDRSGPAAQPGAIYGPSWAEDLQAYVRMWGGMALPVYQLVDGQVVHHNLLWVAAGDDGTTASEVLLTPSEMGVYCYAEDAVSGYLAPDRSTVTPYAAPPDSHGRRGITGLLSPCLQVANARNLTPMAFHGRVMVAVGTALHQPGERAAPPVLVDLVSTDGRCRATSVRSATADAGLLALDILGGPEPFRTHVVVGLEHGVHWNSDLQAHVPLLLCDGLEASVVGD